ncbi:hypothetical protein [Macrococcoides caseolyticum]|uniref:hypothetical protein n=1 Tax=Macrococcoides caseolyticum TaxID=69966 RepID=UPI0030EBE01F
MHLKIQNSDEYKKLLDAVAIFSNKISIVVSINEDFEKQSIYMQFKNNFISSSVTKKWPGTISTSKSLMYTFTFDRDMKNFLKKYPNFFTKSLEDGYIWYSSLDDIEADFSFYKNDDLIMYTTGHEQTIIVINSDLKNYIQKHFNHIIDN